jgi:hypothetical protein
MKEAALREYLHPPASPDQCIFAQTTRCLSADFETNVEPCQFGGDPDCSRCGCFASMGLAAIGHHKVLGPITAGDIFWASAKVGRKVKHVEDALVRLIKGTENQTTQSDESGTPTKLPILN